MDASALVLPSITEPYATGIAQMRREKPDLVLLDITLAEMGGWKLVSQRLNDPELRKISTIILSGIDDDLRSHALASLLTGASLVLNEPYRPENLIRAIEQLQDQVSDFGAAASYSSGRTISAPFADESATLSDKP